MTLSLKPGEASDRILKVSQSTVARIRLLNVERFLRWATSADSLPESVATACVAFDAIRIRSMS